MLELWSLASCHGPDHRCRPLENEGIFRWLSCCVPTCVTSGSPPTDEGAELLDASTSEPVARWSSEPVDVAGGLRPRPDGRRPGAAPADLHRAGRDPQAAGRLPQRPHARRTTTRCPSPPARPCSTPSSTSTAASACCSPTPPRAAASCPTPPSTSTARSSQLSKDGSLRRPSTSTPPGTGWRCSSTPSTSRSGECWRSSPRRSWPAFRWWSSRPSRPAYLTERVFADMVESQLLPPGADLAGLRRARRPARPPDRPGRGLVHRLGGHRPPAAPAPAW